MEYSIKCYYDPSNGRDYSKLVYLGKNSLADEITYNHYLSLLGNHVPFTVNFETYSFEHRQFIYHQFVVIHGQIAFADATLGPDERAILLVTSNRQNLFHLSQAEYNDENRINELLERIARQDLTRFFNR